ncbi:hypothetical protein ACN38_g9290 [Penicillium nordicum]|uniref:Uncharacterized protein n=1 Tax=Penicillium nordicum TaxID=229535 RepID=A0A0M9WCU8_9EURO|nr:hypothetical protein ACN38_g9290 [Penicillium nordicum]
MTNLRTGRINLHAVQIFGTHFNRVIWRRDAACRDYFFLTTKTDVSGLQKVRRHGPDSHTDVEYPCSLTMWGIGFFYMYLYVPDFPWRVGLSYLSCRRFYEGAQAQAH